MEDITKNEIHFLLKLFKSPEKEYNARNISLELGLSHTGTLKIAKRLEKQEIIVSKKVGNAILYNINKDNVHAKKYILFLLQREASTTHPYIKRWITELQKVSEADVIILFGSVLRKKEKARDIDALFITDNKRIRKLEREIEGINLINIKRIHPVFQSDEDFKRNIAKGDKVVLGAVKGIVVKGASDLWRLMQ